VRSNCHKKNIKRELGFLTDKRRINVALTRSKYLLIVVGNADTLGSDYIWNNFLKDL
jgi:regulator of nonsense transcripts 1